MTAAERIEADTAMTDLISRTKRYDDLQKDIDRYTASQGTIHAVNLLADQGVIAITDPDMLAKAENALTQTITAKQNEQAAI